jgi:hypothetical protein
MDGIPVTVNQKRWRLVFRQLDKNEHGRCDAPHVKNKQISISPTVLNDEELYLATVLHEILHAACWSLDEEYVTEYAKAAAKTAIRLGFRLTEEPHGKKPKNTR